MTSSAKTASRMRATSQPQQSRAGVRACLHNQRASLRKKHQTRTLLPACSSEPQQREAGAGQRRGAVALLLLQYSEEVLALQRPVFGQVRAVHAVSHAILGRGGRYVSMVRTVPHRRTPSDHTLRASTAIGKAENAQHASKPHGPRRSALHLTVPKRALMDRGLYSLAICGSAGPASSRNRSTGLRAQGGGGSSAAASASSAARRTSPAL
jgi:hypothetical protein